MCVIIRVKNYFRPSFLHPFHHEFGVRYKKAVGFSLLLFSPQMVPSCHNIQQLRLSEDYI